MSASRPHCSNLCFRAVLLPPPGPDLEVGIPDCERAVLPPTIIRLVASAPTSIQRKIIHQVIVIYRGHHDKTIQLLRGSIGRYKLSKITPSPKNLKRLPYGYRNYHLYAPSSLSPSTTATRESRVPRFQSWSSKSSTCLSRMQHVLRFAVVQGDLVSVEWRRTRSQDLAGILKRTLLGGFSSIRFEERYSKS